MLQNKSKRKQSDRALHVSEFVDQNKSDFFMPKSKQQTLKDLENIL